MRFFFWLSEIDGILFILAVCVADAVLLNIHKKLAPDMEPKSKKNLNIGEESRIQEISPLHYL